MRAETMQIISVKIEKRKKVIYMTLEEVTSGESKYLEFKREVSEKSENYMKTEMCSLTPGLAHTVIMLNKPAYSICIAYIHIFLQPPEQH